jgi:hypothetical protein
VSPVLDEREYKCTNESDTQLVTGWLELQILIFKLVPQVVARRAILDHLDQPYLGGVHDYDTGIDIDKASGVIFFRGRTYDFTPIYHLTLDKPDPRATPDFSILHRILTTAEERDFLRLLETDEQTRPEHHMTLLGLETVAALLERRRLYKIAERFHRRVLMSREMALGPHHEDTLDSVHKVAAVLLMQERYRAASLFSHRYLLGGTAGDEPANTAPSGFGN